MTNAPPARSRVLAKVEAFLRASLPPRWTLEGKRARKSPTRRGPDVLLSLTAPDGTRVLFAGEARREAFGQPLREALARLQAFTDEAGPARPLFIAPWLSVAARDFLAEKEISYADATGNVRLLAERPGLFITRGGADKNPWPPASSLQSLRGKGTMRALRALLDFQPPFGVRELAGKARASPATLSRVIDFLERENLLERGERGAVSRIDWAGAIRRWALDYDVLRTNESAAYLQPRGIPALTDALRSTRLRYALTGSLATRNFSPVAPVRLAMAYVDNLEEAADALELKPADAGANVMLLEPFNEVVFERASERDGLRFVSPSQLAVDLLTGPGRAPSEGEALLEWMKENIDAWRV